MIESDEKWARERMIEVLRADPVRAVREDNSTRALVDLVCGDLLQYRARLSDARSNAATAMQALRECDRADADPHAVRTRVQIALSALEGRG